MKNKTNRKYSKTFHLPWSAGITDDDKVAKNIDNILNIPIIATEKCDGGNCSFESDNLFARTHSSPPTHPSFDLLKSFHATIKHKIPNNLQLFGENMYALHSIAYSELPGYFLLFNVRENNLTESIWLSWDEVEMWAEEIGVPTAPVLFKGIVKTEKELQELTESLMIEPSKCGGEREGVVVRLQQPFLDKDFSSSCMKMVRFQHVKTSDHWAHNEIVKNKLKSDA